MTERFPHYVNRLFIRPRVHLSSTSRFLLWFTRCLGVSPGNQQAEYEPNSSASFPLSNCFSELKDYVNWRETFIRCPLQKERCLKDWRKMSLRKYENNESVRYELPHRLSWLVNCLKEDQPFWWLNGTFPPTPRLHLENRACVFSSAVLPCGAVSG